MHLDKIAVHNFGPSLAANPLSKSQHLTEENINSAHRNRWPEFRSELNGSYIGYNVVIYPNGELRQYRFAGEETAAQKGHNFDTFSICLAGNFTNGVELPTFEQRGRLKSLLTGLLTGKVESIGIKVKSGTTFGFTRNAIHPHRVLQPNHTSCYGSALSDSWARDLVAADPEIERKRLISLIEMYKKVLELLKRKQSLGSAAVPCSDLDVRG